MGQKNAMNYKGYKLDVYKEDSSEMIIWSITRPHDNKIMTSGSEFANFDSVSSVTNDLKSRIDKWIRLPMNKKQK